jgi:hypothetical protein
MTNLRPFRGRARLALGATLAIVAGSVLAATPSARAATTDMSCNYDYVTFNSCLKFERNIGGWRDVYVGQDVYMPAQYAREILACGAQFRLSRPDR